MKNVKNYEKIEYIKPCLIYVYMARKYLFMTGRDKQLKKSVQTVWKKMGILETWGLCVFVWMWMCMCVGGRRYTKGTSLTCSAHMGRKQGAGCIRSPFSRVTIPLNNRPSHPWITGHYSLRTGLPPGSHIVITWNFHKSLHCINYIFQRTSI